MFGFRLKKVEDIEPWGEEPDLRFSYFALSYSYYWLRFGETEFPRYNPDYVRKHWNGYVTEDPHHLDYQFMRVYDDTFATLPFLCQSVSPELFEIIRDGKSLKRLREKLGRYREARVEDEVTEEEEDLCETLISSLFSRHIDFLYLIGAPEVFLFRYEDRIYAHGFAFYRDEDGCPMWENEIVSADWEIGEFVRELHRSSLTFVDAMEFQLRRLFANPPAGVHFDAEQMNMEQQQMRESVSSLLKLPGVLEGSVDEDWDKIAAALRLLVKEERFA
ncbi:DUF5984 family protein [Saccharibacillus sp. CPCC 101409]|uniref:DUF5984 family protein n=1 Tax=Saccharibacillus sp. CPCC 101409 TaxID=3058041 RepID=UPI0026714FA4|nr:DUF5984 family protein [Saccharibacillus sp. CPCC 101409]MDO3410867.1 DUF5984 family protein [Saccharibacillus sp. CPCC 101409]